MSAKILIVDDEPAICRVLSLRLKAEGYVCATANQAERAAELLETEPFSLLISDINMPGMSGMALLELARQLFPRPGSDHGNRHGRPRYRRQSHAAWRVRVPGETL